MTSLAIDYRSRETLDLEKFQAFSRFKDKLGTGATGSQVDQFNRLHNGTSTRVLLIRKVKPVEVPVARAVGLSARDKVISIQSTLGLSTSQLATALGVERQTIYNWLQSPAPAVLQERTKSRLADMFTISEEWGRLCGRPAKKLIHTVEFDEGTLLDHLTRSSLNRIAITSVLNSLSDMVNKSVQDRNVSSSALRPEAADDRIVDRAKTIKIASAGEE